LGIRTSRSLIYIYIDRLYRYITWEKLQEAIELIGGEQPFTSVGKNALGISGWGPQACECLWKMPDRAPEGGSLEFLCRVSKIAKVVVGDGLSLCRFGGVTGFLKWFSL